MTRMKILIVVGVMAMLIIAATVGVFAASSWGPSDDNRASFNGVCPKTGESTEFCLGQQDGRGQQDCIGQQDSKGQQNCRGQQEGIGQGNRACNGTGTMMRQAQ